MRLYKNNIGATKLVHRLVVEAFFGKTKKSVNHIDYDKTNNNINNLEIVSHRQNIIHSYKRFDSYSKFNGVSYYSRNKKWCANISINGKNTYLGLFKTEYEAKNAYNKKLNEIGESISL